MTAQKVSQKNRKINILTGLTQGELAFLDRKINRKKPDIASRSAILRLLVRQAMENPALLDIK